eukprot:579702-Amphidinium_carterae.1
MRKATFWMMRSKTGAVTCCHCKFTGVVEASPCKALGGSTSVLLRIVLLVRSLSILWRHPRLLLNVSKRELPNKRRRRVLYRKAARADFSEYGLSNRHSNDLCIGLWWVEGNRRFVRGHPGLVRSSGSASKCALLRDCRLERSGADVSIQFGVVLSNAVTSRATSLDS